LQTTLFNYIGILGITPGTALLIVVSYAVLRGDVEGAIAGFFAGLLTDVMYMDFIGMHALLFGLTGFLSAKIFKDFFKDSFLLPVLLILIVMPAYEIVFYLANLIFVGNIGSFWNYLLIFILPGTIYTALFAIPVYRIIFAVNKRLTRSDGGRRRF